MKKTALWVQRICKFGGLSILIMLAFGQVQLYLQIKDSQQYINLGFPFPYFWFSHDDDQLSGAKLDGAFIDFCLTLSITLLFYWLFRIVIKQLSKSRKEGAMFDN